MTTAQDFTAASLYTFWKRTLRPPAMLAFDAASRETCIVREARTNTPVQALNLMNDVTYIEASRVFAERMIHEGGSTAADRLSYGFRLLTARRPSGQELAVLLSALNRYEDRYQNKREEAGKFLAHGERMPDKRISRYDLAAYTAVASLILNLDETITKE